MTLQEAAAYLRIAPSTLSLWRKEQRGPKSFKIGRRRFWAREDLDAWINEQRHKPD